MRHIPEDELHAYLDQALSRSQCVEIESHLAACPACSGTRDGIAALRDRTTALLSRLSPPRNFSPAFDSLQERAAARTTEHRSKIRTAAWAASVAVALGVGYAASSALHPPLPPRPAPSVALPGSAIAAAPAASTASAASAVAPRKQVASIASGPRRDAAAADPSAPGTPADSTGTTAARRSTAPLLAAPMAELSSQLLTAPGIEPELSGVWRTVSWDNARKESGADPVRIDGLPVIQVQVQQSYEGQKPVMVVAQQLASGQLIRTIEGPINDVSQLLARRGPPAPAPAAPLPNTGALASGDGADVQDGMMAMQRGDQMLAITGRLPSDSLRAMIRRLNAVLRAR